MANENVSAAGIAFPGNERANDWTEAFQRGQQLDKQFPGQDAEDFAIACRENGYPDAAANVPIVAFVCIEHGEHGENDGADWVWLVRYADDTIYRFQGGCDYTGWDCQSDLTWDRF